MKNMNNIEILYKTKECISITDCIFGKLDSDNEIVKVASGNCVLCFNYISTGSSYKTIICKGNKRLLNKTK